MQDKAYKLEQGSIKWEVAWKLGTDACLHVVQEGRSQELDFCFSYLVLCDTKIMRAWKEKSIMPLTFSVIHHGAASQKTDVHLWVTVPGSGRRGSECGCTFLGLNP